jgi:NAD(P)H-hydrate epimerase
VAEVEADRAGAAVRLARRARAVVVLKGPGTVVACGDPSVPVILSPHAAPNLAVGGSGDVLAGVLGRLLAAGLPPLLAACLGVYWHGLCGLRLAADFPRRGNTAVEIADALPRVFSHIQTMKDDACSKPRRS